MNAVASATAIDFSVIIVNYHGEALLMRCLETVFEQKTRYSFEVIVVDNESRDGVPEAIQTAFPSVHVIANTENMGFAAGNNQGFAVAKGRFFLLVNPDVEVLPGAFDGIIHFMETKPECAVAGALLLNPEGGRDPSARRFISPWRNFLMLSGIAARLSRFRWFGDVDYGWFAHDKPLEVEWVPGTFTAYRREVVKQLNGFDERFFLYYEETDFCLRAHRAGLSIWFTPDARVLHVGGGCSLTRSGQEALEKASRQVLRYRLMAEALYYRKNFGFGAAFWAMEAEYLWHGFRRIWNLRPGKKARREASAALMKAIREAVRRTDYGRVTPKRPW